jgi:hypothetical protein
MRRIPVNIGFIKNVLGLTRYDKKMLKNEREVAVSA